MKLKLKCKYYLTHILRLTRPSVQLCSKWCLGVSLKRHRITQGMRSNWIPVSVSVSTVRYWSYNGVSMI